MFVASGARSERASCRTRRCRACVSSGSARALFLRYTHSRTFLCRPLPSARWAIDPPPLKIARPTSFSRRGPLLPPPHQGDAAPHFSLSARSCCRRVAARTIEARTRRRFDGGLRLAPPSRIGPIVEGVCVPRGLATSPVVAVALCVMDRPRARIIPVSNRCSHLDSTRIAYPLNTRAALARSPLYSNLQLVKGLRRSYKR